MNILITGYKGFIGQNMVEALSGHNLSLLELGDPIPRLHGLDWVVHLGANSSTTETNVEKIMAQNYDFSIELLNRCNVADVNLQYSSSASVYGLKTEFSEDSPVDPKSPYAWSKYLFDHYVLNNARFLSVHVQGFRYFNVYGKHEDHKGSQASPYHKFVKQAKETGVIKLFEGSDKFLRDFVPVDLVTSTHKTFLNIKETGIWNVGTGKARSFEDVAKEIAGMYNAKTQYIPMPENLKGQYQAYTCANIEKLVNTVSSHDTTKKRS